MIQPGDKVLVKIVVIDGRHNLQPIANRGVPVYVVKKQDDTKEYKEHFIEIYSYLSVS